MEIKHHHKVEEHLMEVKHRHKVEAHLEWEILVKLHLH